jgi:hypothetical protein
MAIRAGEKRTKFRVRMNKKLGNAGSNNEANDSQFLLLLPLLDQCLVEEAT